MLRNLKPLRRKDIVPRQLWTDDGPVLPKEKTQANSAEEPAVEDEATDEEDVVETDAKPYGITSPPSELPPSPKAMRKLRSQARHHVDTDVSPCAKGAGSKQPRTPFHNWLRKKGAEEQSPVPPTKREADATPMKREAEDAPGSLPGPKRTRASTRHTQSA